MQFGVRMNEVGGYIEFVHLWKIGEYWTPLRCPIEDVIVVSEMCYEKRIIVMFRRELDFLKAICELIEYSQ
jgi:hypothetical protein